MRSLKEKISLREECNNVLNEIVTFHSMLFPDLRYIQNLWALGIVDDNDGFYEESHDTIVRILPRIKNLINAFLPNHMSTESEEKCRSIIHKLEKLGFIQRVSNTQIEISNT